MEEISLNFEQLEKSIFQKSLDRAQRELSSILSELDDYVLSTVDNSLFHFKCKREKRLKTIFGTIRFSRGMYEVGNHTGKKETVFLLDQLLGIETAGLFSHAVAQKVCELRKQGESYKRIATSLKEENNLDLTRQAIPHILKSYKCLKNKIYDI